SRPVRHFHGAASRVAVSETAFALRQDHLLVELIAGWEPHSPEEDQRHGEWARRATETASASDSRRPAAHADANACSASAARVGRTARWYLARKTPVKTARRASRRASAAPNSRAACSGCP